MLRASALNFHLLGHLYHLICCRIALGGNSISMVQGVRGFAEKMTMMGRGLLLLSALLWSSFGVWAFAPAAGTNYSLLSRRSSSSSSSLTGWFDSGSQPERRTTQPQSLVNLDLKLEPPPKQQGSRLILQLTVDFPPAIAGRKSRRKGATARSSTRNQLQQRSSTSSREKSSSARKQQNPLSKKDLPKVSPQTKKQNVDFSRRSSGNRESNRSIFSTSQPKKQGSGQGSSRGVPNFEPPKFALPKVELPKIGSSRSSSKRRNVGSSYRRNRQGGNQNSSQGIPKLSFGLPKGELPKRKLPNLDFSRSSKPRISRSIGSSSRGRGRDRDRRSSQGIPKLDFSMKPIEFPKVELPQFELPKVELPKVDLPKWILDPKSIKPPKVEFRREEELGFLSLIDFDRSGVRLKAPAKRPQIRRAAKKRPQPQKKSQRRMKATPTSTRSARSPPAPPKVKKRSPQVKQPESTFDFRALEKDLAKFTRDPSSSFWLD